MVYWSAQSLPASSNVITVAAAVAAAATAAVAGDSPADGVLVATAYSGELAVTAGGSKARVPTAAAMDVAQRACKLHG
jgi:hypothetical protein